MRMTERIAKDYKYGEKSLKASITERLDKIASELEQVDPKMALAIDQVSDRLDEIDKVADSFENPDRRGLKDDPMWNQQKQQDKLEKDAYNKALQKIEGTLEKIIPSNIKIEVKPAPIGHSTRSGKVLLLKNGKTIVTLKPFPIDDSDGEYKSTMIHFEGKYGPTGPTQYLEDIDIKAFVQKLNIA
jgi:hypothetical protein